MGELIPFLRDDCYEADKLLKNPDLVVRGETASGRCKFMYMGQPLKKCDDGYFKPA